MVASGGKTDHGERYVDDILDRFKKSGIPYTKAVAVVKQIGSVDQVLDTEVLYDTTYQWIGMGLSQGEGNEDMMSWIYTTIILFRSE